MTNIKPIETRYAGCRFRSRLEARWAVFFDHLGIEWQYEPEGYRLAKGSRYLPDFLINPDSPTAFWFEVKGVHPSDDELSKAQQLATGTGLPAYVYFGEVKIPGAGLTQRIGSDLHAFQQRVTAPAWGWDNALGWYADTSAPAPRRWEVDLKPTAYRLNPTQRAVALESSVTWWTDCGACGHFVLKVHGQPGPCPFGDDPPVLYPNFRHETPRLIEAYTAARSARFEHGETPSRPAHPPASVSPEAAERIRAEWSTVVASLGRRSKKLAAITQEMVVLAASPELVLLASRWPAHADLARSNSALVLSAIEEAAGLMIAQLEVEVQF